MQVEGIHMKGCCPVPRKDCLWHCYHHLSAMQCLAWCLSPWLRLTRALLASSPLPSSTMRMPRVEFWRRVCDWLLGILEKLPVTQLLKTFLTFLYIAHFLYCVYENLPQDDILSQMNPVHNLAPYFHSTAATANAPTTRSLKVSLPFTFCDQNFVCIFNLFVSFYLSAYLIFSYKSFFCICIRVWNCWRW